jgi:DHA2 family multidrug resistance protein
VEHPEERRLSPGDWIGFTGMVVGVFMAILDIQIVSSSLQQIQAGLSASRDEITWVTTAYLIAEVVVIPLSGWLGTALSTRWLFTLAAIGFTLTSLLCALADSLSFMIIARVLQGVFGGVMIPTLFSVTDVMFPPRLQTPVTAVAGLVITMAPTAGPVLGGYLTETWAWQALFLVNLLPGVLVSACCFFFVKVDQPRWELLRRIDFVGILCIVMFLGALQFVLEEGVRKQWFESAEITFFATLAAAGLVGMVWRELTAANPVIDLHAFRNLNFTVGCFFSFVLGVGLYTVLYLMPVYLAAVKGLNSLQIGGYLVVTGMAQFVSAMAAGWVARWMDARAMLALGLGLYGLGAALNGVMNVEWGYWEFFWPQFIRGFSMMFIFLPTSALALGTLPPLEVPNASGLFNLMRNLGGAIGLAVSNTMILHFQKSNYAGLRESVTGSEPAVQAMLGLLTSGDQSRGLPDPALSAMARLTQLAVREADVMTFNQMFQWLALLFLGSLLLIPLVKRVSMNAGAGGH